MRTRSSNSAKTKSSDGKETGHGGHHRLGDPGEIVEERRHRHPLLPHGRADAARRVLLHQGRHPSARRAPRAIGRLHGAGLQPPVAEARRVHGGERPRHDQPHHRRRQRADRLLPGRRDRRLKPHRPERPPGFPGDRPACHHEAVHQMGRSRLQPQAHPGAGECRLPESDERQARPGLSRFSRRHSLRQDSRGAGRLEPVRPAAAQRAAARRSQQGRCAGRRHRQGAPADHPVRQRRDLVAGLAGTAGVRRKDRHSVLHHAAGPRRAAGRP